MSMSVLGDLLRKVGVLPQFTADDILDASVEDKFFDHQKAVAEISSATEERRSSNQRLRLAIRQARVRATPFAELENAIRGDQHREHP